MVIFYKKYPIKILTYGLNQKKGRSRGKITVRHRGGGFKKNLRLLDNKRVIWNTPALVLRTEYNPLSNSWISLLSYTNGYICYSLSPENLNPGDIVISGRNIPLNVGNSLPLKDIPIGAKINNVESKPNQGAVYARAAGNYSILLKKKDNFCLIKLPSGKIAELKPNCMATIGVNPNRHFYKINLLKAGPSRNKGIRPSVRGVAMNPIDHPHGGGEGKKSKKKLPMSVWGKKNYPFKKIK